MPGLREQLAAKAPEAICSAVTFATASSAMVEPESVIVSMRRVVRGALIVIRAELPRCYGTSIAPRVGTTPTLGHPPNVLVVIELHSPQS